MIFLVYLSGHRLATPAGPPTHPVFMSQQDAPDDDIFEASIDAYKLGLHTMKG